MWCVFFEYVLPTVNTHWSMYVPVPIKTGLISRITYSVHSLQIVHNWSVPHTACIKNQFYSHKPVHCSKAYYVHLYIHYCDLVVFGVYLVVYIKTRCNPTSLYTVGKASTLYTVQRTMFGHTCLIMTRLYLISTPHMQLMLYRINDVAENLCLDRFGAR